MKYSPKAKNKKAIVMTAASLVLGVWAFAASNVSIFKFRGLLQVIGAAILAFAVYFMLKTLVSYTYFTVSTVEDGAPSPDSLDPKDLSRIAFIVSKRFSGGRETYVCSLDLSTLIAVKELDDSAKKSDVIAHFKPCDVYDYTITLGRKPVVILVFAKHGYNKTAVVCELNERMTAHFKTVKDINLISRNED